jgi:hypothetical protein
MSDKNGSVDFLCCLFFAFMGWVFLYAAGGETAGLLGALGGYVIGKLTLNKMEK